MENCKAEDGIPWMLRVEMTVSCSQVLTPGRDWDSPVQCAGCHHLSHFLFAYQPPIASSMEGGSHSLFCTQAPNLIQHPHAQTVSSDPLGKI